MAQNEDRAAGFSRTDLVVLLGVVLMLTLMLLPALARTKTDSRAFQCLSNSRQLARALRMFADDNAERLPINGGSEPLTFPLWIGGWLDWSSSSDNTNTLFLTDPRFSALAVYCGHSASVFKCPADVYLSPFQRFLGWKARVRSVSANACIGERNTAPPNPAYALVGKYTEFLNPKPSETWVTLDEHPDSINDGTFYPPDTGRWIDLPANYHDGGAGVAFADGRAEIHRWQASGLQYPVRYATSAIPSTSPSDPDLLWLRYRTPRKPGMN